MSPKDDNSFETEEKWCATEKELKNAVEHRKMLERVCDNIDSD